jgi:hypothetical protein
VSLCQGKNGQVLYAIRGNKHKHLLGLYDIEDVTGVVKLKRRIEVGGNEAKSIYCKINQYISIEKMLIMKYEMINK